ncbi:MAG: ROK family protein [Acidobacteriota bacterium]
MSSSIAVDRCRRAIGVDVGGSSIKLGLVDGQGSILEERRIASLYGSGQAMVAAVAEAVDPWCSLGPGSAVGIGIGLPGLIDQRRGVVRRAPNLPYLDGFPITSAASDRFALPVRIDNDANAAGLAEAHFGAAVGADVAVCLTLGTGVGGAIIEAGRVWRGHGGLAGEIGHIVVRSHGSPCGCGGHGCLETEVAAAAVVRRYLEAAGDQEGEVDAAEVGRRAASGDAAARAALAACGRYLGIGLAILVNLLNPQRLVIGGGLADAGGWLVGPARQEAARRAWTEAWEDCDLVAAVLGAKAGLVGAACLAWQGSASG